MKILKSKICLGLLGLVLLAGCKKDEVGSFSADSGVNFIVAKTQYSFVQNASGQVILEGPVRIIGNVSDKDRTFKVEVVRDSITTAPDNQYQILEGVVKAGKFDGTLSVKLLNSPDLIVKTIGIKLKLIDSEDFKAGNKETSTTIIEWTDKILVPSWTRFRFFFTSVASTSAYRLIIQTTGLTSLSPAEFNAMGQAGAEALATQFGDYVKQWNKDNPNNKLKHDDGTLAGQEIVPLRYTKSKFD
jgi:hypothetical protein